MPRRKPTGAQILAAALKRAGQGLAGYYQMKEAERERKLEEEDRAFTLEQRGAWREALERSKKELAQEEADKAKLDTLIKLRQSFGGMSIPFPEGGGGMEIRKPIPTGMDAPLARLGEAYERVYGKALPPSLGVREYPTTAELFAEQRAQETQKLFTGLSPDEKKRVLLGVTSEKPPTPSAAERDRWRWINLSLSDKRTPTEELEFKALNKRFGDKPIDYEKETEGWDKKVRDFVLKQADFYPWTAQLLTEVGRFSIPYSLKPEGWSNKDWNEYKFEQVKIRRLFGDRPQSINANVASDVRALLPDATDEEIQEVLKRR